MSFNPQNPNGQATEANSAPVVIASDQSAVAQNVTEINGTAVTTAASTNIPKVAVADGSGTAIGSTSGALNVNISSGGGSSGVSAADEATWTAGSSNFAPIGGAFNDSAAALTSGQEGTLRATNNRGLHTNLRNAAGTEIATSGNPLRVDPTGTTTQPVSGTLTVNALPAGTNTIGGVELVDSGGTNKAAISAGGAVKVDGSAVTQPVSGTVTANVGTTNGLALDSSVNGILLSQGSTTSGQKGELAQGAVTTAAPTYTTAQTNPLSLDTSGNLRTSVNNTVTVSGTVTTSPPSNASINLNQVGGSAVATAGTGIAKVGLTDASGNAINSTTNALNVNVQNSTVAVTESGTWTVQPGNTANTTPWLTSLSPATSGGWSVSSQTGLTNTIVSVKASAGQLGGYMMYNPNPSVSYIQVFNSTVGGSTLGSPTYVIPLPPNAAANIEFANGIAHSTAISVAAVATTPTGSTAPATNLVGFVLFK